MAWRNLVHDRVRFGVTLVGIAFSMILVGIHLGMLLNFLHTTSTVVDQAGADPWLAAHGVPSVELETPINGRRRFQLWRSMASPLPNRICCISAFGSARTA